jgi:outer membrane cobalamin receptor
LLKLTMNPCFNRRAALASPILALGAPQVHAEPIAAVVATATRNPQPLADVISDSVVIDASTIARSGAASLIVQSRPRWLRQVAEAVVPLRQPDIFESFYAFTHA